MAVYDGFFDAALDPETGRFDREYNSEDFTGYFASFLGDGVCLWNNPDSLRVSPKDGGVEVAPGYLFLQGYWLKNDSPYPLAGLSGGYVAAARLNTGLRFLGSRLCLWQRLTPTAWCWPRWTQPETLRTPAGTRSCAGW